MIKRAMLQTDNTWLINLEKGFELNTHENIIIAVKKSEKFLYLVKETEIENEVQLLDFNFAEPTRFTKQLEDLFKHYDVYMCDNLKEVAELVENNGWKL